MTMTPAPDEPKPTPSPTPAPSPTSAPSPDPAPGTDQPKEPESLLGDEKPKEPVAAEPFDPDKLTIPEGMDKDSPLFAEFKDVAKETGLSSPAAQKLVDLHAKYATQISEKIQSDWKAQNDQWQRQIREDKDVGGDKLNGNLQTFAKVASDPSLSDPEFRQALLFTGAGNHPAVVKTLVKWAAALSEGGSVQGGPPKRDAGGERTLGDVFYPGGPSNSVRNIDNR